MLKMLLFGLEKHFLSWFFEKFTDNLSLDDIKRRVRQRVKEILFNRPEPLGTSIHRFLLLCFPRFVQKTVLVRFQIHIVELKRWNPSSLSLSLSVVVVWKSWVRRVLADLYQLSCRFHRFQCLRHLYFGHANYQELIDKLRKRVYLCTRPVHHKITLKSQNEQCSVRSVQIAYH